MLYFWKGRWTTLKWGITQPLLISLLTDRSTRYIFLDRHRHLSLCVFPFTDAQSYEKDYKLIFSRKWFDYLHIWDFEIFYRFQTAMKFFLLVCYRWCFTLNWLQYLLPVTSSYLSSTPTQEIICPDGRAPVISYTTKHYIQSTLKDPYWRRYT